MKVFVYGTLKRGERNHEVLGGASRLGECCVDGSFSLVDYGDFPGVTAALLPQSEGRIHGEVYVISPVTLEALDLLEDYPDFYDRILVATPWGAAWMYVLTGDTEPGRVVPDGRWPPARRR